MSVRCDPRVPPGCEVWSPGPSLSEAQSSAVLGWEPPSTDPPPAALTRAYSLPCLVLFMVENLGFSEGPLSFLSFRFPKPGPAGGDPAPPGGPSPTFRASLGGRCGLRASKSARPGQSREPPHRRLLGLRQTALCRWLSLCHTLRPRDPGRGGRPSLSPTALIAFNTKEHCVWGSPPERRPPVPP